MDLQFLSLRNFRNYSSLDLALDNRVNIHIFIGDNAQGKTNLLEAIYFLGTGKSYRTNNEEELIRWGTLGLYVRGEFIREGRKRTIEVTLDFQGKTFRVNSKPQRRIADFIGQMNVVSFSPDDLYIVKGAPFFRRRFLNLLLSQLSRKYLQALVDYRRILLQRNNALKRIKEGEEEEKTLESWTEQLIEVGTGIIERRQEAIERLNNLAGPIHREIAQGEEGLSLEYRSVGKGEAKEIKEAFRRTLEGVRKEEIIQGMSLAGPHRDDIILLIEGKDIRIYGSEGQQRTAALSLRMAELELMRSVIGEYPLLLLDDVLSELDPLRSHYFLKLLNKGVQALITSTRREGFEEVLGKAIVYGIKGGTIDKR